MAKKKTATKRRPAAEPDLDHIAEDLRPLAVAIGELKVDPENARTHDEANIEAIAASLKEFGQLKPVVANRRNGQLLAGNGTLEAARRLGWTHLAVVWGEYDAKAQRGFSVADNRTAELAGWNDELLLEQIDLLREETPDLAAALQLADLANAWDVPAGEMPPLPEGDRAPFQQMTFTLHDDQAAEVKRALDAAKKEGPFLETGNENSNGNALARIVEHYLGTG